MTDTLTRGGPSGLLRQLLLASTEVRELVQCLITRLFAGDGALGEAALQEVLRLRVAEVRAAVVAESARWGDSATSTGENGGTGWYGEADYEHETRWLRESFIPQRGVVVQRQLRQWWSRSRFDGSSALAEPTAARCLELFATECVGGCCSSSPCQNGGRCADTVAAGLPSYECDCPVGFGGPACGQQTDQAATTTTTPPPGCEADVNGDGGVNVSDLLLVLGAFGLQQQPQDPAACLAAAAGGGGGGGDRGGTDSNSDPSVGLAPRIPEDVNGDCGVGVADLLLTLSAFGTSC